MVCVEMCYILLVLCQKRVILCHDTPLDANACHAGDSVSKTEVQQHSQHPKDYQ